MSRTKIETHGRTSMYTNNACRCALCSAAMSAYKAKYYIDNKDRIDRDYKERMVSRTRMLNAIKLSEGCADCGHSDDPAQLDFDHLPQFEKLFTIGGGTNKMKRLTVLMGEIDKCDVVCKPCHKTRTKERTTNE